jgi:hypothetical protein
MATILTTEIEINASPEKVWNILMDFEKYPDWNPFIKSITGNPSEGNKIEARIEPPNGSAMTFRPTVLRLETNQEFRWLGHLLFPGLFDGEHFFILKDNGNGKTTFIQGEKFGGILVPLFKKMLDNNTRRGFVLMNEALKKRSELGLLSER